MTTDDTVIPATIWNEYVEERKYHRTGELYPEGIHGAVAQGLRELLADRVSVGTATLDQPDNGLPAGVLDGTDVLLWWGHLAHDAVDDDLVDDVCRRVYGGMGLVVLHSALDSKVFRRLMAPPAGSTGGTATGSCCGRSSPGTRSPAASRTRW